ncbi:MAG: hypothetical protein ISS36_04435 [Candidatus Aenigmarchaeota archaeon]|nr:hypothetical protein [Candidatus Aenigmarchaeota archaeon]
MKEACDGKVKAWKDYVQYVATLHYVNELYDLQWERGFSCEQIRYIALSETGDHVAVETMFRDRSPSNLTLERDYYIRVYYRNGKEKHNLHSEHELDEDEIKRIVDLAEDNETEIRKLLK